MKRTHDEKWLRENALFACQNDPCEEECTFPANYLRLWKGNLICEGCYEGVCDLDPKEDEDLLLFRDLPAFQPFSFGGNEDA